MSDIPHGASHPPTVPNLAEGPVEAYLGSDERLEFVLTNRRVGVSRAAGDEVSRVAPGRDYGAIAVVTDRRLGFLVGDPDGHDGDYVASIPTKELAAVETRAESLAQALLVETTAGATWEFTVREGDLDGVVETLGERLASRLLREARAFRTQAADADDVTASIDLLEESLSAFQRVARLGVSIDDDAAAESSVRAAAETVIADLVRSHLERARNRRSRGNWDAQAGDEFAAAEHFAVARESYDRTLELARSYPPGDADDIEARFTSLDDRIADLSLTGVTAALADDD